MVEFFMSSIVLSLRSCIFSRQTVQIMQKITIYHKPMDVNLSEAEPDVETFSKAGNSLGQFSLSVGFEMYHPVKVA